MVAAIRPATEANPKPTFLKENDFNLRVQSKHVSLNQRDNLVYAYSKAM